VGSAHVDTLLLADWAEAIDGKLYVMGGGMSLLRFKVFPGEQQCALAAILKVPRDADRTPISLMAHLETAAGNEVPSWRLDASITPQGLAGATGTGDGVMAIAGPVHVAVDEPADLLLRFRFGNDERTISFKVRGH